MSKSRYLLGDLLCYAALALLALPIFEVQGGPPPLSAGCICDDTTQHTGWVTCAHCTGQPPAPSQCSSCCPSYGAPCELQNASCGANGMPCDGPPSTEGDHRRSQSKKAPRPAL